MKLNRHSSQMSDHCTQQIKSNSSAKHDAGDFSEIFAESCSLNDGAVEAYERD